MKNDPRFYECNLCNCEGSLKKKIQDFKGIWTRDLAIPVRCSNQLSHEATDVGSWSSMYSYVPVKEMNVIDVYEINHIRTAEMKSSEEWSTQLWTQFMWDCQDFNGIWNQRTATFKCLYIFAPVTRDILRYSLFWNGNENSVSFLDSFEKRNFTNN